MNKDTKEAKVEMQAMTALMLGRALETAASLVRQSKRDVENGRVSDRTAERLADVAELIAGLGGDFVKHANKVADQNGGL